LVNRSIYERAVQLGVADDVAMEFLCEGGHLECGDLVSLRLTEFDTSSLPGSVTAHGRPSLIRTSSKRHLRSS
jgi:hypothetical protein